MDMNNRNLCVGTYFFLALLVFCVIHIGYAVAEGDSDGTDEEIEVDGDAGGGFPWNEVHGFVMIESGYKVEEPFNITLCKQVKWQSEGEDGPNYYASGYIFGELRGILWDDDPEPSFLISREELEEHKSENDDDVNTTVYILGEYVRSGTGTDEVRKAYREIKVQRPNHAPVPIARITDSDEDEMGYWENWTTVDADTTDEIVYYIDLAGVDLKFYLTASESWDQDGDNITDVQWDLDGDGEFGKRSNERKMNTTVYLGEGDHTLGLIAGDGYKYSEPLDIRIIVRQPIRYPDLTIKSVEVINKNGEEFIEKGDHCSVIAFVKNMGDIEYSEGFDVYFEYWHIDTNPEPHWNELGAVRITGRMGVNGLKLVEIPWDTEQSFYTLGTYVFRSTVDPGNVIQELRELNNQLESENTSLLDGGCNNTPELRIKNIEISSYFVEIHENINITVTLTNSGTVSALYVDVHYFIDGVEEFFKTIEHIDAGGEGSLSFLYTPPDVDPYATEDETHDVYFTIHDDGSLVETSEDVAIITVVQPPPPPPPQPNGTAEKEFPLVYVIAGSTVVAISAITFAVVHIQKKRKGEIIW